MLSRMKREHSDRSLLSIVKGAVMRRAFTLIETLVTIAVLSILASLLLSALSSAKGKAKRITCSNNLHQIDAGLLMYISDQADFLRSATNDHHVYFNYNETIRRYLSRGGSTTNDQLFFCPSDDFDCSISPIQDFIDEPVAGRSLHHLKQTVFSSYILNAEAASPTNARVTAKPLSSVQQPSSLVLECEFSGAIGLSTHDRKQPLQFNNAKNMMAFVDGHVSFIPVYWNGNTAWDEVPIRYNPPMGYQYKWLER